MDARHDALCGAAELVLAAERCGVTATVGRLDVRARRLERDSRARDADARRAARRATHAAAPPSPRSSATARAIARRRGLRLTWTVVQELGAVACDPRMDEATRRVRRAPAASTSCRCPAAPATTRVAMSALGPVAMLFVRCKGGVSHHPDESVKTADVAHAIAVLAAFVRPEFEAQERRSAEEL